MATPRIAEDSGRDWLAGLLENVRLTPKGHDVAMLLARSPRDAAFLPASQLAAEIGVNVATVVRFAQSLGFSGWKEFQLHFRHRYLASVLPSEMARQRPGQEWSSPFDAVLHQDVENLHAALSTVDRAVLAEVVAAVTRGGRIVVVSAGDYAAVGQVFVHKMNVMGYDARLETRGGVQAIAAVSSLTADDCLVAISFLRLIRHVVVSAQEAAKRGVPTIAITDSIFSPLARAATHTLMVPTESISWFQSLTAAISVVLGLTAEVHAHGGERVEQALRRVESLYGTFDVLYDWRDT